MYKPAVAINALIVLTFVHPAFADQSATKRLPPNAVSDYQLGGSYKPPAKVTVVVRDSTGLPAKGLYNICYVNGFQTQPGVKWPNDLLVSGPDGKPLADPGWPDEYLLNVGSDKLRARIFERLRTTISTCAKAGFNAIEFDNLDSYTRSKGALTAKDAIAFARLLVRETHDKGMAAGQKNAADLSTVGRKQIGFDFAVSEECHRFDECAEYTKVYGNQIINIEYAGKLRGTFAKVCADPQTPKDTLLRDLNLVPAGNKHYVYKHC